MARGSGTDDMIRYGLLAAVAYVGYKAALGGGMGENAQKAAVQVCGAFASPAECAAQATRSSPAAGQAVIAPGTTLPLASAQRPATTGGCSGGPFVPMSSLAAQNPNIAQQIREWQQAVGAARKYNWGEFRTHVLGLQAPDPGGSPPQEFCS